MKTWRERGEAAAERNPISSFNKQFFNIPIEEVFIKTR
jgi:hypothetical protein